MYVKELHKDYWKKCFLFVTGNEINKYTNMKVITNDRILIYLYFFGLNLSLKSSVRDTQEMPASVLGEWVEEMLSSVMEDDDSLACTSVPIVQFQLLHSTCTVRTPTSFYLIRLHGYYPVFTRLRAHCHSLLFPVTTDFEGESCPLPV